MAKLCVKECRGDVFGNIKIQKEEKG